MHNMTCVQEAARAKLQVAYEHSRPEARKLELLSHGNGFSFEASPFCSYAHREGVHVVLAGEVSEWPGISAVAAAHDGEPCVTSSSTAIPFYNLLVMC
jgi:hypothetical protein